jgi:hypothetical protein
VPCCMYVCIYVCMYVCTGNIAAMHSMTSTCDQIFVQESAEVGRWQEHMRDVCFSFFSVLS